MSTIVRSSRVNVQHDTSALAADKLQNATYSNKVSTKNVEFKSPKKLKSWY